MPGRCTLTGRPIEIGQLEWFLPEREKLAKTSRLGERLKSYVSPWAKAEKPPIAVVGSGPAGLINAYLLAGEGYPVTIFEAFHELGGVLRYGIPEFRLGNASNPIIKDSEPELKTTKWGTITVGRGSQKTSLEDVYSGGDATRGGATAVLAAGDGQAAAREIVGDIPFSKAEIEELVEHAGRYTDVAQAPQTILKKVDLAGGIVEMTVKSPLIAKAAQAGQFVRL